MDISIKPIITEKANRLSEAMNSYKKGVEQKKLNFYTFAVSPNANKYQIKDLVEKLYNVRVVRVNIANYAGKRRSRYTKAGLLKGKTPAFKKAYVKVAEGQAIDYYSKL